MEFFRIANIKTDEAKLHETLRVENLPDLCESIYHMVESDGDTGEMFCLWGHFRVHREPIRGGVRFTLPTCPNALAWTVTTGFPPEPGNVVIHATMNRTSHDPDFIESVGDFLDDWKAGIEENMGDSDDECPMQPQRIRTGNHLDANRFPTG